MTNTRRVLIPINTPRPSIQFECRKSTIRFLRRADAFVFPANSFQIHSNQVEMLDLHVRQNPSYSPFFRVRITDMMISNSPNKTLHFPTHLTIPADRKWYEFASHTILRYKVLPRRRVPLVLFSNSEMICNRYDIRADSRARRHVLEVEDKFHIVIHCVVKNHVGAMFFSTMYIARTRELGVFFENCLL